MTQDRTNRLPGEDRAVRSYILWFQSSVFYKSCGYVHVSDTFITFCTCKKKKIHKTNPTEDLRDKGWTLRCLTGQLL